jgi:hypothetical protein
MAKIAALRQKFTGDRVADYPTAHPARASMGRCGQTEADDGRTTLARKSYGFQRRNPDSLTIGPELSNGVAMVH